ncbi:hypothetical protein Pan97_00480 [Bremerella volcania]|uniref:Uncharacterized protein n=1 Tax=Bremerella volcania TaxID=2527984 RepID=A0A518C1H1_9BACT|nr:hypothetical protein Pan97_00480 [Bremerella volcania]
MAFFGIAIFLSFLLSFITGLMSICYALLRHLPTAKTLGWFAVGTNAIAVLGSIPILVTSVALFLPAIVPSTLGLIAIALCQSFKGYEPVKDRQIPLAMLFYLVAVFGLLMSICMCFGALLDLDLDP